jgi:outer membrane receptor protein involved in Fe transport
VLGDQPSYATFDLATGISRDSWRLTFYVENVTDELGEISRYSPCATSVCTSPNVVTLRPRSFGLSFGQRF